jgi:hypothetical protein
LVSNPKRSFISASLTHGSPGQQVGLSRWKQRPHVGEESRIGKLGEHALVRLRTR